MTKWEYRCLYATSLKPFNEGLAKYGEQGFELVSVAYKSEYPYEYLAWLKRPVHG